jgi:Ca2+-binding RTX toxin-like protein
MPARTSQGLPDVLDNTQPSAIIHINGTTGDDTLVGPADIAPDTLAIFTGHGGDDVFIGGGAGQNLFRDGPGVDSFFGGSGFNRVSFAAEGGTQPVYANLATGVIVDAFGNTEQMTGIQSLGWGSGHDTLIGDDHANLLFGREGDLLFGAGGDDAFLVNEAPALIDGGSGVNTLIMNGVSSLSPVTPETHGATIDLGRQMIVDDGFGGSGTLLDIQNVYGSELGDVIIGDKADNVLMGLGGDDTLTGGGGADIFRFNGESTDFDFNSIPNGHDLITDFRHGDRIDIDMPGVTGMADLTLGADDKGNVVITYDSYGDTITLLHVHHVTAADFIFGPI